MKKPVRRLTILLALAAAVALVFAARAQRESLTPPFAAGLDMRAAHGGGAPLPRLVDLGADRCIPCKAMAPILESLRVEYAGQLDVQFIDVWKDPDAGVPYRVHAIPTQIFFDRSGRELFRHEGFYSKDDILATWKRFGYDFPLLRPSQR